MAEALYWGMAAPSQGEQPNVVTAPFDPRTGNAPTSDTACTWSPHLWSSTAAAACRAGVCPWQLPLRLHRPLLAAWFTALAGWLDCALVTALAGLAYALVAPADLCFVYSTGRPMLRLQHGLACALVAPAGLCFVYSTYALCAALVRPSSCVTARDVAPAA